MAKGKKTGGNDFKPGQSGNPNGRPKLPGDIKNMRQLNKLELERLINKYLYMTPAQIQDALLDQDTPSVEGIIAKTIMEVGKTGNWGLFDSMLNRIVGKVTEKIEHTLPRPTIVVLGEDEKMVLGAKIENEDE